MEKELHFSLTTDMWTSLGKHGYMGLTLHYINDQWKLQHLLLGIRQIAIEHTGELICKNIKQVLNDWNLPTTAILALATDNAASMAVTARELGVQHHVPCAAHTLNLVVQDALKSVDILLEKCR